MDSDHLSIYIEQYCHNNSNVMEKIIDKMSPLLKKYSSKFSIKD